MTNTVWFNLYEISSQIHTESRIVVAGLGGKGSGKLLFNGQSFSFAGKVLEMDGKGGCTTM